LPPSASRCDLSDDINAQIREILENHGRLGRAVEALEDTDDLYSAGLTSHANVNVMLALESKFDVEFPDDMLKRGTFDSISSIRKGVTRLLAGA
jgi:acyl carrier protein